MKRGTKIGLASVVILIIALAAAVYYIFTPYYRASISRLPLAKLEETHGRDAEAFGLDPELSEPLPPYAMRARLEPSFGVYSYIITFNPLPKGCVVPPIEMSIFPETTENWCTKSRVTAVRKSVDASAPSEIREFEVPGTEYNDAFGRLRLLWENDTLHEIMSTDGTGVGVEIRTNDGVMSFSTNDRYSPKSPITRINSDILRMMLAYGPDKFFPCSLDWTVARDMDDRRDSVKSGSGCLLTLHQEQEQPAP